MKYILYIIYVPIAIVVITLWGVTMFFGCMLWHLKWYPYLNYDQKPDFMPLDSHVVSYNDLNDIVVLNPFFKYSGFADGSEWKTNFYFPTYYHYLLGICNRELSW